MITHKHMLAVVAVCCLAFGVGYCHSFTDTASVTAEPQVDSTTAGDSSGMVTVGGGAHPEGMGGQLESCMEEL